LRKKVQKADQSLTKIIWDGQEEWEQLEKIPQNELDQNKNKFEHHFSYLEKRNVDSYLTTFTYTKIDSSKISIIE
jgi:hypothetical protein